MSVEQKVNDYIRARTSYEKAEKETKRRKRVYESCEKSLLEELLGLEGKTTFKLENGTSFGPRDSFKVTIPKHQYHVIDEFLAGLDENPDDYFERAIKSAAITAFLKGIYKEQGAFALPQLERQDGTEASWYDAQPKLSVLGWAKNYGVEE